MSERLCTWDADDLTKHGYPTQTFINFYEKWAFEKFGVVLTGNVMVDPVS